MNGGQGLSRRGFLKVSWVAGAGLLIGTYLEGCTPEPASTPIPTRTPPLIPEGPDVFQPSVFVRIGTDESVTITVHRSEMGQGVRTALPMILAEELDADWSAVRLEQADADPAYGDQLTGGSVSVAHFYVRLRQVGAAARNLLLRAAAQVWGVDASQCSTEAGWVFRANTQDRLSYGQLVPVAATLDPSSISGVELKDKAQFRLIGSRQHRIDGPDLVTGRAVFGMDVRVPGMVYAVVARSPAVFGRLIDFNDTETLQVPGVRATVPLDDAVGIVADSTWSALQGRNALKINTDAGTAANYNSADEERSLLERLAVEPRPDQEVAYYVIPFLSHSPMEPMNCVADARADSCEVWVPTQNPQDLKQAIQSDTGLSREAVTLHVPLLGGGFGRRLNDNYPIPFVSEAVQLSRAVGSPVKLMWTREEDIHHEYYFPLTVSRVRASLDDVAMPDVFTLETRSMPTGAWRAVTNVMEAFARESFLDEYALALGRDPLDLRRELWPRGRARVVQDLAAEKAGWGEPLPPGRARGFAYHATWDATHAAQVAEVSVDGEGHVRVHRVVCAVDCGVVINPDIVEAQMEGGIIFGLTAALKAAVTIEQGQVQQSNFDDYPLLRMDETPAIEVYIVPSDESPTGIGEMANPVIAPAVANAVFAATGKRVRRLPIRPEDLV